MAAWTNEVSRDINAKLLAGLREPFVDSLARFLGCEPEPEVVAAWARRNPDRWVFAVKTLAGLSGLSEIPSGGVTIGTLNILAITKMSDSELRYELAKSLGAVAVNAAGADDGGARGRPARADLE